jgi:hypothetical protein
MRNRSFGAFLAVAAVVLPTAAAAEWTLGNNVADGVTTVFLTYSDGYGSGIAFVCDNTSAARPEYILVVTTPFVAALGRLEVTVEVGTKPPTTSTWTAQPRDNRFRSRDGIVVRDVLAAIAGEPVIAFSMRDDFARDYRVEAPVDNLLDLAPGFLAGCDALPPAAPLRF